MKNPAFNPKKIDSKDKGAKSENKPSMNAMETITPGDPYNRRRSEYGKGAKAPEQLDFFGMMMR